MAKETVRVHGYKELMKAASKAEKESKTLVRAAFREAAEPVRADAVANFSGIDTKSAAGFRVAVRQRGVAVEQRLKRTTGRRKDYGALQMSRALIPALESNADQIERRVEKAVDTVADHFEGKVF